MQSRNTIAAVIIILLLLSVLFSGCTGKKNIAPATDSIKKKAADVSSQNVTQSSKEENMPEIKITSFSSIYLHDNNEDIYLFSWENVPGNESHSLLNYLRNDLHIDWVETAQITKDDVNKTIRVFTNENSIEIMLYNESVLLKRDRGNFESYGLWVREKNGTHDVYYRKGGSKNEVSERYYAVYGLSLKNNGSGPFYFKMNRLRLHEGDRIFNTTTLEPYSGPRLLEVMYDLKNENTLQDTTLLTGQTVNGTVAFRVNSLYNESFFLVYNTTPVTSASFEKSIKALWRAEHFNYQVASGVPPYANCHERGGMNGSYEPVFDDYCDTWANWVNRSIFETYQKSDVERLRKSPPDNILMTEMVYALRVFPEKNISMFPVTTRELSSNLLVIDDTGGEMINTSGIEGVAVLSNQTYTLFKPRWKLIIPRMNFTSASLVRISFKGSYMRSGRVSFSNQDVILDKDLKIIVVRYYPLQLLS